MKKAVWQGLVIAILFFSTLLGVNQVDWVTILNIEKTVKTTEEKLGEFFWEIFRKQQEEQKNQLVIKSIDSLVSRICNKNKIEKEKIKVHILNKDVVNAFALPDGHLIIYSGLILATDSQEELSGVICHEIAHIQLNHVMKKLVKEIGLSALVAMATGDKSLKMVKETMKILSSSAFDRSLEKEADSRAVEYLIKASIDPEPFADFLYKAAARESEIMSYLSWSSTHPGLKERAEHIIRCAEGRIVEKKPVLKQATWKRLKVQVREWHNS